MIAAILNGLGGGILWCSLGKYISACATEETKGYYFGVFWFFYMGSQVVGSLLGAFILSEGLTQIVLFAVLALFGLIATFGMLYTRQPLAYKQKPLTTSVLLPRRVLNESQTTSDSERLITTISSQQPLPPVKTFRETFNGTMKMMVASEFRFFLGQCLWTGVTIAYYSGLINPILVSG